MAFLKEEVENGKKKIGASNIWLFRSEKPPDRILIWLKEKFDAQKDNLDKLFDVKVKEWCENGAEFASNRENFEKAVQKILDGTAVA